MTRELDHIAREFYGITGTTKVVEVADEPFVVMGEIVDLIGHDTVAHHVRMIDTGTCLLLPGGVMVTLKLRINVPGHMPHMGDARRTLSTQSGGGESTFRFFIIPQMNTKVVARVHRFDVEHVFNQRIDGAMAVYG